MADLGNIIQQVPCQSTMDLADVFEAVAKKFGSLKATQQEGDADGDEEEEETFCESVVKVPTPAELKKEFEEELKNEEVTDGAPAEEPANPPAEEKPAEETPAEEKPVAKQEVVTPVQPTNTVAPRGSCANGQCQTGYYYFGLPW